MRHNIDSTQTHGNGDTRAQELLCPGDTDNARQIMKTEYDTQNTGNIGCGSRRRPMAVDMWDARRGEHRKRGHI